MVRRRARRREIAVSADGGGRRVLAGSFEAPELAPGSYLYLRLVQQDGGAAWSSPFFITD